MSPNPPATSSPEPSDRGRLVGWIVAALVLLAVLGTVGVLLVQKGSGTAVAGRTASPTAVPVPAETRAPADPGRTVPLASAAPAEVPSVVLARAPGLPHRLPPVALAAATGFGNGVTARLVTIRSFTARGLGAGEVSGPALAVTVELTNRSTSAVSLSTASVSLYGGRQGIRASVVHDGASLPFAGQLAPGQTARAVYVFSVPLDQRDQVAVLVGTSPAAGTAVFAGPVP